MNTQKFAEDTLTGITIHSHYYPRTNNGIYIPTTRGTFKVWLEMNARREDWRYVVNAPYGRHLMVDFAHLVSGLEACIPEEALIDETFNIELNGKTIIAYTDVHRPIPGQLYIAKRNTGWHLLTCALVQDGYVVPVEDAYYYDVHECYCVKEGVGYAEG